MNPDNLIHLRIILKSGAEFTVKSRDFNAHWNSQNILDQFTPIGCFENFPVHLDLSEVAAIVRVNSNEEKEDE